MHDHAVHFYRDDVALCRRLNHLIVEALAANQPALVVSTSDHSASLVELLSRSLDVGTLKRTNKLAMYDAESLLDSFVVGNTIDWDLLEQGVCPVIDRLAGPERQTILAYWEMADVLCKRGLLQTALWLEDCWNHLARERPLRLVCPYRDAPPFNQSDRRAILWRHTSATADYSQTT
jgi:hypothetical protein